MNSLFLRVLCFYSAIITHSGAGQIQRQSIKKNALHPPRSDAYSSVTTTTTPTPILPNDNGTASSPDVENIDDQNQNFTELYKGDQVLRILVANSKHRKKIKELEYEGVGQKWAANTTVVDLYVRKGDVEKVSNALTDSGMSFAVMIENVQDAVRNENPALSKEEEEFAARKGHRMTFQRYHRIADLHGFMDYYASEKSNFVSVETIGTSVEGRPIKVMKISSGKPNATAMWIDGGIHAREWISPATVAYVMNELIENRDSLKPEIRNLDFHILPLMNPDGYEYSHERERLWRKNRKKNYGNFCVGTDLNRNWAYEWGGEGAGKYACQETYAGSEPLSEPETKATASYISKNSANMKGFITFHSYGQYILYPWGYKKRLPSDHEDMDRVGRLAAAAMKQISGRSYTVGNSASLLYAAAGGEDDWAKGTAKIKYSYTIELRDNGKHGFLLPASHIVPSGKEAFAAIAAIAKEIN